MTRLVWTLPLLLLAVASCLPRKPPRREERLYFSPTVRPQRLSGAEVTGSAGSRRREPRRFVPPTTSAASVEVDEFTGHTRISVRDQMLPHLFDVILMTVLPGAAEHGALLTFRHYSGDWEYLRCHQVNMLVDGAIFPLPQSEHDGRVQRGGVTEDVSVRLDAAALRALLHATTIRVRVCNDDWTFTPRMHAGFAEVRDRIFPPEPSGQPPDEPRSELDGP